MEKQVADLRTELADEQAARLYAEGELANARVALRVLRGSRLKPGDELIWDALVPAKAKKAKK